MEKYNDVKCLRCGYEWKTPPDVIHFFPLCKICERANNLLLQIFHIVGQDGPISTSYELIIHPEVFKKFRLFKEFPNKPGKYNKTHIYKKDGKYGIKLQQRFFTGYRKEESKLIFHNVKVILDKNIFWWYMKKVDLEGI